MSLARVRPEVAPVRSPGSTSRSSTALLLWLLLAMLPPRDACATSVSPSWIANGVSVAADAGDALLGVPLADGLGGAFVTWQNRPAGTSSIEVRVQHLMPNGTRDVHWPAAGVALVPGGVDKLKALSDGAGGLYVISGGSSISRVVRLRADGTFAPGWSSSGVTMPPTCAVSSNGTVWGFSSQVTDHCVPGFCQPQTSIRVTALGPDGAFIASWAPPGRLVLVVPNTTGLAVGDARGFEGGVGVLLSIAISIDFGGTLYFGTVRIDGSSTFQLVGSWGSAPDQLFDVDRQGGGLLASMYYDSAALQKFAPAAQWPDPGWSYPQIYGALVYGSGLVSDGAGGAFVRSWVSPNNVNAAPPTDYPMNHVLASGAPDPAWPLSGISTPNAGRPFETMPQMSPDARGGVFLAWQDKRFSSDSDIYATWFDPSGALPAGWSPAGHGVCVLPGSDQTLPSSAADATGNVFVVWRDTRNSDGDIYAQRFSVDAPVPALVQRASARWVPGGAEITWDLSHLDASDLMAERSGDAVEWTTVGKPHPATQPDRWQITDTAPLTTQRNHYRLRASATGWTGGDVTLDPTAAANLRLTGVVPNPVDVGTRVSFSAALDGAVEFVVTDVLGRKVAERRVEGVQPGAQSVAWTELARLPAGLYWLRARQADRTSGIRFAVTR